MALLRPIALNYRHVKSDGLGGYDTDGSGTLRTTDRNFLAPSILLGPKNEANHAGIDEKRSQAVGLGRQ